MRVEKRQKDRDFTTQNKIYLIHSIREAKNVMDSRSETVRREISTPFKEGAEAVAVAVAESLKLSLVGIYSCLWTLRFWFALLSSFRLYLYLVCDTVN